MEHEARKTQKMMPKYISITDILLHKEYELYKGRADYQAEMPDTTGIRPFYPKESAMFAID